MSKKTYSDFQYFDDLFYTRLGKYTKKFEKEIDKRAIEWFEQNFCAIFSKGSTKDAPTWYYSGGILCFDIPNYGSYYYAHIVMKCMFEKWKNPEYMKGFKYRQIEGCHETDCPYPEYDFYKRAAWRYGFNAGFKKISFRKLYKKFTNQ